MRRDPSGEPPPEFLPHFRPRPGDPVIPEGVAGVRIATAGVEATGEERRWPLHGTFRVPAPRAGAEPEAVLRQVVLALTSGTTHDVQARHAFRDEVVFREDVLQRGPFLSGAFHLDLLRLFGFVAPRDTYFIVASIGEHVSEAISCEGLMPWLDVAQASPPPDEPSATDEDGEDGGPEEEGGDDGDTSWMVDEPF